MTSHDSSMITYHPRYPKQFRIFSIQKQHYTSTIREMVKPNDNSFPNLRLCFLLHSSSIIRAKYYSSASFFAFEWNSIEDHFMPLKKKSFLIFQIYQSTYVHALLYSASLLGRDFEFNK